MKNLRTLSVWMLCVLLIAVPEPGVARDVAPLAIVFESGKGYEVNRVPAGKTLSELVDFLRSSGSTKDTSARVSVIVASNTTITDIVDLRGILEKVGFSNIRYFYSNQEKTRMAEIVMNHPAVPYTFDPGPAKNRPDVVPKP